MNRKFERYFESIYMNRKFEIYFENIYMNRKFEICSENIYIKAARGGEIIISARTHANDTS